MDQLKYFLEAASRRANEKQAEGRWGGGIPQMDILKWWEEMMRKREEEARRQSEASRLG
jgi:hypothetical protein